MLGPHHTCHNTKVTAMDVRKVVYYNLVCGACWRQLQEANHGQCSSSSLACNEQCTQIFDITGGLSLPLCGMLVISKFDVMRCEADQRSVLNTNYLLMQHLVSAHQKET